MVVAAAGDRAARAADRVRAATARCSRDPNCRATDGPGRRGRDRQLHLRAPAADGDGSITVRVTSLTGLIPTSATIRPTAPERPSGVGEGRDHRQGGHHTGIGVRGDHGHRRPRRADAAQLHPRHRRQRRGGDLRGLAAVAAADSLRRHADRLRVRRRRQLDRGRHRPPGRPAVDRAGRDVRRLARRTRSQRRASANRTPIGGPSQATAVFDQVGTQGRLVAATGGQPTRSGAARRPAGAGRRESSKGRTRSP